MTEHPRILIADGAEGSRKALVSLMAAEGAETVEAADAESALATAAAQAMDLILLDMDLPGGGGLDVLKQLKARAGEEFVPVMLLAPSSDLESKVTGLRSGADDYMARPLDNAELAARVHSLLRIKGLQDQVRATKRELERLSVTDGLTGLYNHRYLQDRLREEFRRAQRYGDSLALIMADLDKFKYVNDKHGHPAGDQLLRAVAASLTHSVRETDIVARYGGDEFAVILPQTHLQGALTVAERVWRGLGQVEVHNAGDSIHMTASIGVSFFPNKNVSSPEVLLRVADEALYRSKREGRNKICLYQDSTWFYTPGENPPPTGDPGPQSQG